MMCSVVLCGIDDDDGGGRVTEVEKGGKVGGVKITTATTFVGETLGEGDE